MATCIGSKFKADNRIPKVYMSNALHLIVRMAVAEAYFEIGTNFALMRNLDKLFPV